MRFFLLLLLTAGSFVPALADTTISAASPGTSSGSGVATAIAGSTPNMEVLISYKGSLTLPDCIDWKVLLQCSPGDGVYTPGSRDGGNATCKSASTDFPKFSVTYYSTCDEVLVLTATLHGSGTNSKWDHDLTYIDTPVPARGAGCSAVVRNPVHVDIAAGGTASAPLVTSVTGDGGTLSFKPSASGDDGNYYGVLSDETGKPGVTYTVPEGTWHTDHWTTPLDSSAHLDFKAPTTARPGDETGSLMAEITCE